MLCSRPSWVNHVVSGHSSHAELQKGDCRILPELPPRSIPRRLKLLRPAASDDPGSVWVGRIAQSEHHGALWNPRWVEVKSRVTNRPILASSHKGEFMLGENPALLGAVPGQKCRTGM